MMVSVALTITIDLDPKVRIYGSGNEPVDSHFGRTMMILLPHQYILETTCTAWTTAMTQYRIIP